jgi:hypothetical protein
MRMGVLDSAEFILWASAATVRRDELGRPPGIRAGACAYCGGNLPAIQMAYLIIQIDNMRKGFAVFDNAFGVVKREGEFE